MCVCEDRLCVCVCAYALMYVRTYGAPPYPQKNRKSMPPKTVAKPYQFEALVIIFDIFAIRRFSGIPGGVHSANRLIFVYVCEGFSYLCVFVKIDCVFVFGLMYLCL